MFQPAFLKNSCEILFQYELLVGLIKRIWGFLRKFRGSKQNKETPILQTSIIRFVVVCQYFWCKESNLANRSSSGWHNKKNVIHLSTCTKNQLKLVAWIRLIQSYLTLHHGDKSSIGDTPLRRKAYLWSRLSEISASNDVKYSKRLPCL